MPTKGLFQLQKPQDLLSKLVHDFSRVQATPDDPYTSFDFFVTAEHMLDWLYPGAAGKRQRTTERSRSVLLQIVSHLATGAKHMIPEDPRHQSVQHADVGPGGYSEGPYGVGPYGTGSLIIELDRDAAAAFGPTITPLALAQLVLSYWQAHPALV